MATPKLDLSDDQRFALMKFRRNVSDCSLPPGSDDFYLLKWLVARDFNPDKAEKMLRQSLLWRERFDMDSVGPDWTASINIGPFFPGGICGVDKDHIPVVVFPSKGFDMYGMIRASSKLEFMKLSVQKIQKYLQEGSRISQTLGRPSSAPKMFMIFEMDGFEWKQYTSRLVIEAVLDWSRMYEENFPEILKTCVFINTPAVFSIVDSIIRPFLHENTIRKIKFFGCNTPKWQAYLLEHIDADQLPVYLGGTLTGPEGDPRCSDKICQGGKVPKSMYLKNQVKCEDPGDIWSTALVKQNQKLRLNFDVSPQQSGSILKWQIYADSCDFKFAVYQEDDTCSVVEPRLVSSTSQSSPEVGLYQCQQPSNYIVELVNVSCSRSCQVHYEILLTEPLSTADHQLGE